MQASHLHYFPLPPIAYAIFAGALIALFILIQLGLLRYAYQRIGLSPSGAMLALIGSLLGSYVNIPVAQLPDETVRTREAIEFFGSRYELPIEADWPGTIIAVNIGGAIIPAALSIYLLSRNRIWGLGLVATAIVAAVVHLLARPVEGVGIAVPIFAPPLVAAAVAIVMSRELAAPLAYVSGSLGTLIGADLLNFGRLQGIGAPVLSIGGAGVFDGVFLAGIIAVLLSALGGRPRHVPAGA
ncbi:MULTISPECIES: DUF1614 domain-containing protein [Methylosinus]|uniref:DUF1614 domain-containing protein n=1 Tax=Methylosinus trichosporium (strain ATCC 35070 / NCIMB 11131 / UNIQEM 75 / OB3b) TaxID=595536 RepID=A0A2D2D651_METT3|nr:MULTISPECIES: DUF1614 domain-containing protein [Methylosinus]ATQ70445.1 DUF1614 domain-containing protein [Methylosinus trichosporium OB3b]OBS53000.1 hypothetical protein A8B73_08575 [Methylosinus sp. 3S-1]